MDNYDDSTRGALFGDFGMIIYEDIDFLVSTVDDLRKNFEGSFPKMGGMRLEPFSSINGPTEKEIQIAVTEALKITPELMKEAGMVVPGQEDLNKIAPFVTNWLSNNVTSDLDLKAAVAGERIGLKSNYLNDTFIFSQEGEVDTLIAMKDADFSEQLAAFYIMIMDVILEVFGIILALVGFKAPRPNANTLKGPMQKLIKHHGFRAAFKKLMKGLDDGDPMAILIFIQYLRAVGVFGEIAAAWLANLGWFDYAAALIRLVAWILLATGTGGAALIMKIGQVMLSVGELYGKVGQLGRMWDEYIKEA